MLSALSGIGCIAGIICFFCGIWQVTVAAAVLNLLSQLNQVRIGKQTSLTTAIVACIVGLLISAWTDLSWWLGISIALCFEDAITLIIGWIPVLIFLLKK